MSETPSTNVLKNVWKESGSWDHADLVSSGTSKRVTVSVSKKVSSSSFSLLIEDLARILAGV